VAPYCTPVEKHLQAAAGQLAGRSSMNIYERITNGVTASGTGTVIVARAISACGTGQYHASSESDCRAVLRRARNQEPYNPIRRHCKTQKSYLCGQVPHLKPLEHTKRQIKLEEMFDKGANSHAWKGMKCFAFQCFGLFYSD
jgi:hypothetical protein